MLEKKLCYEIYIYFTQLGFFVSTERNVKLVAMYFICVWLLKVSGGDLVGRKRTCFLFALSLYSQVVTVVTGGKVSLEPEGFLDQKVSKHL